MKKNRINNILTIFVLILFAFVLTSCAKTYTITFDYNYDEVEDTIITLKQNEKIDYPTPTRLNYTFGGWYVNKNCTIEYTETKAKEDKTLYAKWSEIEYRYRIEYDLDGGSCDDLIKSFDNCAAVTLPTPTKYGYSFLGWYENNTLVSELVNKDYKLTAKWQLQYLEVDKPSIDRVRSEQTNYLNVVYKNAGGHTLKMDMYLPSLSEGETCPALFIYFGGGWIMGGKEDIYTIQPIVDYAISQGIAVIVPNYRLAYEATYPHPVEDVIDAIRFCVKYNDLIGLDLDNIGTMGYSAGAHLALMAAFAKDDFDTYYSKDDYQYNIKYCLDMYGPAVYSLDSLNELSTYGKVMLTMFTGTSDLTNPEYEKIMPSYYIKDNQDIDIYIVHGDSDSLVPYSQSVLLNQLLIDKNIDVTFTTVSGADHAFNVTTEETSTEMLEKINQVYQEMEDFIKKEALD